MILLDLFCGAGGASVGYSRSGFDVVGVDIAPQKNYQFEFYQADALEFVRGYWRDFDVIHASPPCQRYSQCTPVDYRKNHPDLISAVRALLEDTGKPFVIENVSGARHLLRDPLMLCGSMFGLQVYRHRYFEIYPPRLILRPGCNHSASPVLVSGTTRRKSRGRVEYSAAEKRAAMDIDWMTVKELDEAIPPAYTEFIGRQLLERPL